MTETAKIISPVDGSVYAERAVATDASVDAAVASARAAQTEWRHVAVAERGRHMLAFLDALLAMNDEIITELAWQMGRPVRFGGEKGGVEERTRAMVGLAEEALRRITSREAGIPALHRPRAAWPGDGDRAVELSLSDRDQHHRSGADRRQRRDFKHATQTLLVGERFADAFVEAGLPKGLVP